MSELKRYGDTERNALRVMRVREKKKRGGGAGIGGGGGFTIIL